MTATEVSLRARLQTSSAGNAKMRRIAPHNHAQAGCRLRYGLRSVLWFDGIQWALRKSDSAEPR